MSTAAPTPAVAPPRASLTALWWKTYVSLPDAGSRCDLGIDKVVFLGATAGGTVVERSCTLPAETSILVPLINVECSSLEGNGRTPAEWRACATRIADDFTALFLTIDGVTVTDLARLRGESQPFAFSPVKDNPFGIPPGHRRLGVGRILGPDRPLAPGTYDASFGGSYPPAAFSTDVTYHLTVV